MGRTEGRRERVTRGVTARVLALTLGVTGAGCGPSAETVIAENEARALEALATIAYEEECFGHGCVHIDQDGDGMGEFAFLGEMAGADRLPGTGIRLDTAPHAPLWVRDRDPDGRASQHGYYFHLWLPTGAGKAIPEGRANAREQVAADADGQEARFACYAWPIERGVTGRRAFCVVPGAHVYATEAATHAYSGRLVVPRPDAAFDRRGPCPENLDAPIALADEGRTACDGNQWVRSGNKVRPHRH